METAFEIIRADGTRETRTVEMSTEPLYEELAEVIRPLLDHAFLEHVAVLHEGQERDMFVDECGALRGLERNEIATAIYRAAYLSENPEDEPETLAAIYGTAILFSRPVWF